MWGANIDKEKWEEGRAKISEIMEKQKEEIFFCYFKNYSIVYCCVYEEIGPRAIFWGQRTIQSSQFFSFTMQVLDIELKFHACWQIPLPFSYWASPKKVSLSFA